MRIFPAMFIAACLWSGPVLAQGTENLQAGLEHFKAGRYEPCRQEFSKALQARRLSEEQRGAAHLFRAICTLAGGGDADAARPDLDKAVELMSDPSTALDLRASVAWETDDREQTLKDLLRLAREFPAELNSVDISKLWSVWRWLKKENRADDRFALVEAVVTAGYQPEEPNHRADELVQQYVLGLTERGKAGEALPWVRKIVVTRVLVEMRVDGAFRALWDDPEFTAHSEPQAAAERELRHWETTSREHPKNLKVLLRHMQALRLLGKSEEAVRIGEAVSKNPAAYEEDNENRVWVLNEHAYALQDMGKIGDAVSLLAPLLDRPVEKEPYLVSQLINLGEILLNAGEPERALKAVDKAKGRVSPYGQKWIDSAEACAFHRLGRTAEAEAAMERLKTNPEENYAALSRALLCLDRVDEAVKLTLVRLRDPDHRQPMLMAVQKFRERSNQTAVGRELKERREAVRSHPDVMAEARKHGRLMDVPLYPVYWGDV